MYDNSPLFSHLKMKVLRASWSRPDAEPGYTWDFDGVLDSVDHWMGYNYEMQAGLATFKCKSFDELVMYLKGTLGRKPNVIDLMGGAYFINQPENTSTLTGIRIHDKDDDFKKAYYGETSKVAKLLNKIIKAPNRKIIEADILTNSGWAKIKEANLPPADLLVCRPVGPFDDKRAMIHWFDDPKSYQGIYISLFKRMISLVDKKGLVFSEIPDVFSNEQLDDFINYVYMQYGSKTEVFEAPSKDYKWGGVMRRYMMFKL